MSIGTDEPDQADQQNNAPVVWTGMGEIKERTMFVNAGTALPLYTGDYYKNVSGGWTIKGQAAFQQTYPLPANILAVILYWSEGDQA